jgi:hypothetical protein
MKMNSSDTSTYIHIKMDESIRHNIWLAVSWRYLACQDNRQMTGLLKNEYVNVDITNTMELSLS